MYLQALQVCILVYVNLSTCCTYIQLILYNKDPCGETSILKMHCLIKFRMMLKIDIPKKTGKEKS